MQGVIERAEFWLWYEYNKQDLGEITISDMRIRMLADAYVFMRNRSDLKEWLERSKRQLQLWQSPLSEQWKRLADYEEAA